MINNKNQITRTKEKNPENKSQEPGKTNFRALYWYLFGSWYLNFSAFWDLVS
jgi:hypothetical protein